VLAVQDHEPVRGTGLIPRSLPSLSLVRRTALIIAVLCVAIVNLGAAGDWIALENCRLILNPANDGDSFHVSAGNEEYIFRLHLVDAPETEGMEPRRLVEQAKNFEITVPQAIEVGEAAKAFTREKLAEPFTVFTRRSDAMGRSKNERLYAFVQTKEGDLGEQLVRNGLARFHGVKVIPPGSSSSLPERQKLQQLEEEAKQEKIGGWGINVGRLNQRVEKPDSYSFFTLERENISGRKRAPLVSETRSLGRIDINTATDEELKTIPGIGAVLARRIIEARPFRSADDLRRVNGIGDKKYELIRLYFQ
jgi:DNA uptake protein ComE-like DNA-binding protein